MYINIPKELSNGIKTVFSEIIKKKSILPVKYYLLHVQPKPLRLSEQEIPGVYYRELLKNLPWQFIPKSSFFPLAQYSIAT